MRHGLLLIAFAFLIGCGPSQRDQPTNEAPLAPASTASPAADNDSADSTPAESTPAGGAAEQLESTTLEEIQKRLDGNVNDRATWDLYIAKVAQLAKASLASDPFESLTIIENALQFCLKHNDEMDEDVRTEVFAQTETVWDPISEEAGKRLNAESGVDPNE